MGTNCVQPIQYLYVVQIMVTCSFECRFSGSPKRELRMECTRIEISWERYQHTRHGKWVRKRTGADSRLVMIAKIARPATVATSEFSLLVGSFHFLWANVVNARAKTIPNDSPEIDRKDGSKFEIHGIVFTIMSQMQNMATSESFVSRMFQG